MNRTGTALATAALALGLLLAASQAQAQVLVREGDNVSGILGLEVAGVVYDVKFCSAPSARIYGDPPTFDFSLSANAKAAAEAVIAELNKPGDVATVGTTDDPDCQGEPAVGTTFGVGFREDSVDTVYIEQPVRVTEVWEGVTGDQQPGVWQIPPATNVIPFLADGLFADFTEVDVSGSGNRPPTADAGDSVLSQVGQTVTFNGSRSSDPDGTILAWNWEFGDGATGFGETVEHVYQTNDTYNVTLTVTDDGSLSDSDSTTALIGSGSEPPVAEAGGPYEGAPGVPVQFSSEGSSDDVGIVGYLWFISGTEYTEPNPTHVFTSTGGFTVSLFVIDGDGQSAGDTASGDIVAGNSPPTADAGPPVVGSTSDPFVTFDGRGSFDPDPLDRLSYNWDFGDGNTASGTDFPSHMYTVAGDYTVTLTVTDSAVPPAQDSDTTSASISEGSPPADPVADADGPYEDAPGVPIQFDGSGSSDEDGTITSYNWDFGDGRSSGNEENPTHVYLESGTYPVTLTVYDDDFRSDTDTTEAVVTDGNQPPPTDNQPPTSDAGEPYAGAVGVPVQFNGTGSDDADGYLVAAQWDFGDTNTGSGLIPTHTYTTPGPYTATLIVTDDDGDRDESSATVVISDGTKLPPTADADGPYTGVAGAPVTFVGTNSSDPDGSIAAWDWAFGDGLTGFGATTEHSYLAGSIYKVILEVTDDDGLIASDSTLASIGEFSLPPTADADGPYRGRDGVAVTFDGTASGDPDGDIVTWSWDFGDGNTGSGATPGNTYAASGEYLVKLTVTDDSGETDTDVTTATIGTGNLPPVADAGGSYGAAVGALISFDGTASDDPDGTIVSWDWKFGDDTTGTGPTPTHSYSEAGKYFVLLTVTDDQSVVDSAVTLADTGPFDLSGSVINTGGTPLCALVLASGQFDFSCNPNGPYDLQDLPRENDGTVKRQVYVDGFFPNVETLTVSFNETVVMTRATNCPDYNAFPEPGVFPESAGKRIDVSGTVLLQNTDTPVCAMVLGNGQFGFTCDSTGSYAANIPLDANGQYKLQVYAQGFAPMVQAFDEFTTNVEVRLARAAECQ